MKFRKLALCMLAGLFMINLSDIYTYAAEEAAAIQVQDSLLEIGFTQQDPLKQILEDTVLQQQRKIESTSISPSEDMIEETFEKRTQEAEDAVTEQEQITTEKDANPEDTAKEATNQQEENDNAEVAKEEKSTKTNETSVKEEKKKTTDEADIKYTKAELRLLSSLIYCEARGESYNGKLAVGIVVMNRVRSSRFPDTVKGVIYQSYQFSPVRNGTLKKALSEYDKGNFTSDMELECIKAAKAALSGTQSIKVKGETKNFSKYLFFSGRLKDYTYKLGNHQFK